MTTMTSSPSSRKGVKKGSKVGGAVGGGSGEVEEEDEEVRLRPERLVTTMRKGRDREEDTKKRKTETTRKTGVKQAGLTNSSPALVASGEVLGRAPG